MKICEKDSKMLERGSKAETPLSMGARFKEHSEHLNSYHHAWNLDIFLRPQDSKTIEGVETLAIKDQKSLGSKINWKVRASVFWDSRGVILINYLEKGKILTIFRENNLWKRRGMVGSVLTIRDWLHLSSVYYLFAKLKMSLNKRKFSFNKEVMEAVESWIAVEEELFFKD